MGGATEAGARGIGGDVERVQEYMGTDEVATGGTRMISTERSRGDEATRWVGEGLKWAVTLADPRG